MQQATSSVLTQARAQAADAMHPWLRALDAFSVPFLCYSISGRRSYVSRAAAELLRTGRSGAAVGDQADRIVAEELSRATPHLHIGQFALVREVPICAAALLLAVHIARPVGGETTAVVVLRPDIPQESDAGSICGLTARELDVARLIARGLATKEIAHRLGISTHTARHHTERVFVKLGVRSRAGAAAIIAARMGPARPAEVRGIHAV